jgi:hypothetical protein
VAFVILLLALSGCSGDIKASTEVKSENEHTQGPFVGFVRSPSFVETILSRADVLRWLGSACLVQACVHNPDPSV